MTKLIGLSGSLRQGSYNTALLKAAAGLVPDGVSLEVLTIHGIPLYDGDLESRDGVPPAVSALKDAVAAADGLVIATPEYNNSVPGTLKNALDWMSRPPADAKRVFGGRPVVLVGASPGNFGTVLSQAAWLPVLRALGVRYWSEGRLLVSKAGTVFGEDGRLADDKLAEQLKGFLKGFAAFAEETRAAKR